MDLDMGINSIIGTIFQFPTAAILLVAFILYVVRNRRPY